MFELSWYDEASHCEGSMLFTTEVAAKAFCRLFAIRDYRIARC